MPNPHEPRKHRACFASNHKTLIFTETGNQSQRSPAATNLVFDFPPAATNLVVRGFAFFLVPGTFLLGYAGFIYGDRRRGPITAPDASKVSKGHH